MMNYIEYLNMPTKVTILLVGAFLVMQIVGEFLEFRGKVVPEFVRIRKYFRRKKQERETLNEVKATLADVKKSFEEFNTHYGADNIKMRDEWIRSVNRKLEENDVLAKGLDKKLDKLDETVEDIRKNADEREAKATRIRILRFGDEILHGVLHSKEHFDQVLLDITEYDQYCKDHPDFKNNMTVLTTKKIMETYSACLDGHKFL